MKGTNYMKTKAPSRTIAKRPPGAATGLASPTKQPKHVPAGPRRGKAFIAGEG